MFVVRPVKQSDLAQLMALAEVMAPGITTFPPDETIIKERIAASEYAFSLATNTTMSRCARSYLLVAEDSRAGRIAGTAAIYTNIGVEQPFYSFKKQTQLQVSYELSLSKSNTSLHLVNDFTGGTEVGTLLVHPDYKSKGLGKLLSKSRYILLGLFQNLFANPVFAELRGWSNKEHESPFWNAVGQHFFPGLSYVQADLLSATTNNQFIADMMPRYPIYVDLLPRAAQRVIGQANDKGIPAKRLLETEGFRDLGYIDIFDAGATLVANIDDLITVKNLCQLNIHSGKPTKQEHPSLFATTSLENFRVITTQQYTLTSDTVSLTKGCLASLNIEQGEPIAVVLPH